MTASVIRTNEGLYYQLLNLSTSLNRMRSRVYREGGEGPRVMVVGSRGAGKTVISTILWNYSRRSGWNPVLLRLDPSGNPTNRQVDSLMSAHPGMVTAMKADHYDNMEAIEKMLDRFETTAKTSNRMGILHEWYTGTSVPANTQTGDHHYDNGHKSASFISNIARREVLKFTGHPKEVVGQEYSADNKTGSMNESTLMSLCGWERVLRPIWMDSTMEGEQEDILAIWTGVNNIEDEESVNLYLHGLQALEDSIKSKFKTNRSSGYIIDCPTDLDPSIVLEIARIHQVDLVLCVKEPNLLMILSEIKPPKLIVAGLPEFGTLGVPRQTNFEPNLEADIFLPRISLSNPEHFIKQALSCPLKGISSPIPARLLFTPLKFTCFTTISVPPKSIEIYRLNCEGVSVTASSISVANCLPLNTRIPGAIYHELPPIQTSCSSPCFITNIGKELILYCRKREAKFILNLSNGHRKITVILCPQSF